MALITRKVTEDNDNLAQHLTTEITNKNEITKHDSIKALFKRKEKDTSSTITWPSPVSAAISTLEFSICTVAFGAFCWAISWLTSEAVAAIISVVNA